VRWNARHIRIYGVIATLVVLTVLALISSGALVRPGYYEAEYMPRMTGRIVWQAGASWGRMVCGEPGNQGALVFGPYDWFEPGTYEVEFATDVQAERGIVPGRVEVSEVETGAILAQVEITGTTLTAEKRQIALSYTLTRTSSLEFRAWYYGQQRLCIDRITNRLVSNP